MPFVSKAYWPNGNTEVNYHETSADAIDAASALYIEGNAKGKPSTTKALRHSISDGVRELVRFGEPVEEELDESV